MDSLYWTGCLIICILCVTRKDAEGCGYVATHPQDQYCSSDFVLVGQMLSERLVDLKSELGSLPGREYTTRVINRLKGRLPRLGSNFTIITGRDGGACGITLEKQQMYALSGHKRYDGNYVGLHDINIRVSNLTPEQMMYLFSSGPYSYRRNCRCKKIELGNKIGCEHEDSSCLRKKGLCTYSQGKCTWQNNDDCQ